MKISRLQLAFFLVPFLVLLSIIFFLIFQYVLHVQSIARVAAIIGIVIGSYDLVKDTLSSILKKKFALDYIAILAIAVAVFTQEYLVAAIIVLMFSGGNTLEKYAIGKAKTSLTALTDRIPNKVVIWEHDGPDSQVAIESVKVGTLIFVRKGEVIPLDGTLESEKGQTDESSLTGEPYQIDKDKGDSIRSGTVNIDNPIIIRVTKAEADSTYRKIIEMVKQAQEERPPIVRLANRYSMIFTIITFLIVAVTYWISRDFHRVLAVLVIATPCPLILATPISLIGGMNASAKKRIIMKRLSSIEVMSRVNTLVFDKTGTITLGKPLVKEVVILDKNYDLKKIYSIAGAIERNSLHPLAKAIVAAAKEAKAPRVSATNIQETIGSGISGKINGKIFTLSKPSHQASLSIQLLSNKSLIAELLFEDTIKPDAVKILNQLRDSGLDVQIFTGDKKESADKMLKQIGNNLVLKAECSPEDKKDGIKALKQQGRVTAMVGDGINDAPALAIADVGIVFSHEEHTAASEAADVVLLGGDLVSVIDSLKISKRTIRIALQSILFGIGLSIFGMLLASAGIIEPIIGAFFQEVIDVGVIVNALRASS